MFSPFFPPPLHERFGQLLCLAMNFVATPTELEELRAMQAFRRTRLLERFDKETQRFVAELRRDVDYDNANAIRSRAKGNFDDANWFAERAAHRMQGFGRYLSFRTAGLPLDTSGIQ